MIKAKFVVIFVMLVSIIIFGQNKKLPELLNPNIIVVNSDRFFVVDGPTIFIYSLTDFQLKSKFGSKGEGPGEFIIFPGVASIELICHNDKIQINSLCKVSFFSLDGRFLNEFKHTVLYGGGQFCPVENKFACQGFKQKDDKFFSTIDIYNSELKKELEVVEYPISTGYDGIVLDKTLALQTSENKIFVVGSNNFLIDVYDVNGKKMFNISQEYKKLKFEKKHKEEILEFYKKDPISKNLYPMIKDRLRFPSYFPAIKKLIVSDGDVYVQTYLKNEKKSEFFVFELSKNLIKKVWLPIFHDSLMDKYNLFCIKNRKLYQLVEDEEDLWHIDVQDIK